MALVARGGEFGSLLGRLESSMACRSRPVANSTTRRLRSLAVLASSAANCFCRAELGPVAVCRSAKCTSLEGFHGKRHVIQEPAARRRGDRLQRNTSDEGPLTKTRRMREVSCLSQHSAHCKGCMAACAVAKSSLHAASRLRVAFSPAVSVRDK